jgi:hypothetical protein
MKLLEYLPCVLMLIGFAILCFLTTKLATTWFLTEYFPR